MTLTADDRTELLQIQNLYGHMFDGRWEFFDLIFTPDAIFDATDQGYPVLHGYDQIRGHVESMHVGKTPHHMATNTAIIETADDGMAQMISKFLVAADTGFTVFGIYTDDCVVTPGGWRIAKRCVKLTLTIRGNPSDFDEMRGTRGRSA